MQGDNGSISVQLDCTCSTICG